VLRARAHEDAPVLQAGHDGSGARAVHAIDVARRVPQIGSGSRPGCLSSTARLLEPARPPAIGGPAFSSAPKENAVQWTPNR
jgi:hypothetical protein